MTSCDSSETDNYNHNNSNNIDKVDFITKDTCVPAVMCCYY